MRNFLSFLALMAAISIMIACSTGCAQISAPTGGATDTLPPRLLKATPEMNAVNFTGNKVSLQFNENIDLQELQGNVIISPMQKNLPAITYNRKSVSIRFRDSLKANTTYSVNFGNAIKDVHEGNILKNFTYVFSTGNAIDSLMIEGKVTVAETGKADSTIMALLYLDNNDTAVLKTKPDYMTRLTGEGKFSFRNLPAKAFRLYALKDGDGSKTYNSKTELFAYREETVIPSYDGAPVSLFAFSEVKPEENKKITVLKQPEEKRLKYTTSLATQYQDLLQPLEFMFNNPLQVFDSSLAQLTDTAFRRIPLYSANLDSTRKKLTVQTNWIPGTPYYFLFPKGSVQDSAGNMLPRADTIKFLTKSSTDYGTVLLRFSNINLAARPVLQFTEGETLKYSYPLVAAEWSNSRFPPGEYNLRILYDSNSNGIWDPGNFSKKTQPEKVTNLDLKLSIRANWDNERDIKL